MIEAKKSTVAMCYDRKGRREVVVGVWGGRSHTTFQLKRASRKGRAYLEEGLP